MRAGARAVAPQLIGVVPFGLVAGATPADGASGWGRPRGSRPPCSPARRSWPHRARRSRQPAAQLRRRPVTSTTWATILVAGIGTFAMRASFIAAADRLVHIPPWAHRLLRQIPPAALASIVLPALVRPEGELDLTHPRFLAGIVAALVAWRTKNVMATLVVGMGLVVILQNL